MDLVVKHARKQAKIIKSAEQPIIYTSSPMTTGNENSTAGLPLTPSSFVDRRVPENQRQSSGLERRQFTNSHSDLSPEAAELGKAIDQYKLIHRRRYISYEETLYVIKSLGYSKSSV